MRHIWTCQHSEWLQFRICCEITKNVTCGYHQTGPTTDEDPGKTQAPSRSGRSLEEEEVINWRLIKPIARGVAWIRRGSDRGEKVSSRFFSRTCLTWGRSFRALVAADVLGAGGQAGKGAHRCGTDASGAWKVFSRGHWDLGPTAQAGAFSSSQLDPHICFPILLQ
ncbi:hypothetical protein SRHO_G00317610 [Serrasalmus rhombeus]